MGKLIDVDKILLWCDRAELKTTKRMLGVRECENDLCNNDIHHYFADLGITSCLEVLREKIAAGEFDTDNTVYTKNNDSIEIKGEYRKLFIDRSILCPKRHSKSSLFFNN